MTARNRTAGHAQATRGSRTDAEALGALADALDAPSAPETDAPSTPEASAEAQAEARAEALRATLAEHDKTEAVNALISAHFNGNASTMLRTVLRSVDPDIRNRALFNRRANADGSVITYDLCGTIGTITRDSSGRFRQDGFLMHARDKSDNTFEKRFGDGTSTYDNVTTPEKNMLAGWRNGVIWILNERETERVKHSGADSKALAEMQAKLAQAEARATQAEAQAKANAEANAQALQDMSTKVDALLASLLAKQETGS